MLKCHYNLVFSVLIEKVDRVRTWPGPLITFAFWWLHWGIIIKRYRAVRCKMQEVGCLSYRQLFFADHYTYHGTIVRLYLSLLFQL
jgi:hypothetical protein